MVTGGASRMTGGVGYGVGVSFTESRTGILTSTTLLFLKVVLVPAVLQTTRNML